MRLYLWWLSHSCFGSVLPLNREVLRGPSQLLRVFSVAWRSGSQGQPQTRHLAEILQLELQLLMQLSPTTIQGRWHFVMKIHVVIVVFR